MVQEVVYYWGDGRIFVFRDIIDYRWNSFTQDTTNYDCDKFKSTEPTPYWAIYIDFKGRPEIMKGEYVSHDQVKLKFPDRETWASGEVLAFDWTPKIANENMGESTATFLLEDN